MNKKRYLVNELNSLFEKEEKTLISDKNLIDYYELKRNALKNNMMIEEQKVFLNDFEHVFSSFKEEINN